jgi:hypothetical protein
MSDADEPLANPVIDSLPTPEMVRERLGLLLREVELLRRLLRVAERAAQERERRKGKGGIS